MQSLKWSLTQYDQYPCRHEDTYTDESMFKRHGGEMTIQKPTRKKKKKPTREATEKSALLAMISYF